MTDLIDDSIEPSDTGVPPSRQISRITLAVVAVAALVLGGVLGLAGGWKIEQSRVKSDIQDIRPVGTVTAVDDGSLTIDRKTSNGSRTYKINKDTSIVGVGGKKPANLVKGSIVLVDGYGVGGGDYQAKVIVVLPKSIKIGS